MKKTKISIRMQVFFALMTIIVIMAAIFSPYGFYTNVSSIRHSLDERLMTAATGVNEFITADFVDRAVDGKISENEYKFFQKKINEFQRSIDVTYLYIMVMRPDGKIYFALDQLEPMMTEYKEPSDDSLEVFKTRKIVKAECSDEAFGLTARTVLLPFISRGGVFYVVGADLNVELIRPMIKKSVFDFIILLFIGILLVVLITTRLSMKISLPIKKLSEFMKKLSDENFSPELKMEDTIDTSTISTNEVSTLAKSITLMRGRLGEYIVNLKAEIAARNLAESELKIAGGIQESFLPGATISNKFIEAAAKMKPAKKAGGDLYDFFEMSDGRLCLAIGDVSGKGMPAALFMARAMTLIRSAAYMTASLPDMVKFINDMLSQSNDSCTFITFFICAFDSKTEVLEYVNCGHNPPFLKSSNGEVKMLTPKVNRILGVFGGFDFEAETLKLNVGDTLVCYTDGVTEALAKDSSFYEEHRLCELLQSIPENAKPSYIVNAVFESVGNFAHGCEQSDDITVLVISHV